MKNISQSLLQEMKNGFPIQITEEEYNQRKEEIKQIASSLFIRMDVLNCLEKDHRIKLLILSLASYFGFAPVTGKELLQAAGLTAPHTINPIKYFFIKAGWMPHYLEYTFTDAVNTTFPEVLDTIYCDVEFYMDMSEHLETLRIPSALRAL